MSDYNFLKKLFSALILNGKKFFVNIQTFRMPPQPRFPPVTKSYIGIFIKILRIIYIKFITIYLQYLRVNVEPCYSPARSLVTRFVLKPPAPFSKRSQNKKLLLSRTKKLPWIYLFVWRGWRLYVNFITIYL